MTKEKPCIIPPALPPLLFSFLILFPFLLTTQKLSRSAPDRYGSFVGLVMVPLPVGKERQLLCCMYVLYVHLRDTPNHRYGYNVECVLSLPGCSSKEESSFLSIILLTRFQRLLLPPYDQFENKRGVDTEHQKRGFID